jgi:hypothetical protein
MTTQTVDRAIGEYVGRCVEYLRDLGEHDRTSILEDIRQILSEVTAELEGAPDDLLGPPDRFVAELRTAAGLDEPATRPPKKRSARLSSSLRSATAVLSAVRASIQWRPAWNWLRDFARETQPGWWVVRGLLITTLLVPSMRFQTVSMLGAAIAVGSVVGSVYLGRRTFGGRRVAGLTMTVLAIGGLVSFVEGSGNSYVDPYHVDTPTTTIFYGDLNDEAAYDGFDDSLGVRFGSTVTEDFSVLGPLGAEEVLQELLSLDIPASEI